MSDLAVSNLAVNAPDVAAVAVEANAVTIYLKGVAASVKVNFKDAETALNFYSTIKKHMAIAVWCEPPKPE